LQRESVRVVPPGAVPVGRGFDGDGDGEADAEAEADGLAPGDTSTPSSGAGSPHFALGFAGRPRANAAPAATAMTSTTNPANTARFRMNVVFLRR
jgi:hypothetical protein